MKTSMLCLLLSGLSFSDMARGIGMGQPVVCTNATCSNAERWALLRHESTFTDWQRVRMQELSNEIPAGSLPRTLDIILRHEIVEIARAGDKYVSYSFPLSLLLLSSGSIYSFFSGENVETLRLNICSFCFPVMRPPL